MREEADHWLPQVKGVPVVAVSGLTGAGLDRLMQAVVDVHAVWNRRVATDALNRWLAEAVAPIRRRRCRAGASGSTTSPSRRAARRASCCSRSRADALPDAYRRYLVNSLREAFDLPGVPIRLTLREKKNPYASGRR